MMKIEKIIYSLALSCLVATPAMSQVEKEVEVTQAFIPQIIPATKPELEPDLTDESHINPDIDYSITPISIHTELDTTPYKPVEMDYWEYKREQNYYAKLGFGLPTSSVADLYASKSGSQGYVVGYLNHDGNYADIKGADGVKRDAKGSHLTIGGAAGQYFGEKMLEGGVYYRNDLWSRYATDVMNDERPLYQRLGVDLRYGDNFSDLSRLNYSIEGGLEQMWSRSDFKNTTFESRFDIGRELSGGIFKVSILFNHIGGSDSYSNSQIGAALLYGVEGERSKFYLGLDYLHERIKFNPQASHTAYSLDYANVDGYKSNYFIPRLKFDYQLISSKLIGYIDIGGEVIRNDFASLSERNQYLAAGLFGATSSIKNELNFGFKGTIADERLGYKISGRYSRTTDQIYWAMQTSVVSYYNIDNYFIANMSDQDYFGVVLASDYRPNSKLLFEAKAQFGNYNNDKDQPWADGMPNTEVRLGGKYQAGAFGMGLNCEMLSRRIFSEVNYSATGREMTNSIEIPSTFNLSTNFDYTLESGMVIFADVTNILNDDLYEWVGYREYGVGFMVGVKFEF